MLAGVAQEDDLWTVPELAKFLKLAVGTIYNQIGHLDETDGVVRLNSKCTRIRRALFLERLYAGKIKLRAKQ